jgi:hypothetical protein
MAATKTTTRKRTTIKKTEEPLELNLETLIKFHGYWDEAHQWLKNFINKNDLKTGVEIGVAFGANMKVLLEETELEKLFGVDSYVKDTWDLGGFLDVDKEFGSFDLLYEHVKQFLSEYGSRANLIRMTSEQASIKFKNESLDFVFIDGDHTDIENDLKYWESKVRDGGYIIGHDWNHPSFGNITEYLKTRFDEDQLVGIDGPVHIWYVQKGAFM